MRRALSLAARGEGHTRPNPPVGAVVVSGGRKVGEGYHAKAGGPHAERVALEQAGKTAQGATLYVTLEPCSTAGRTGPCTTAIRDARIKRVVAAVRDPNPLHAGRGLRLLKRAGIEVQEGVCAQAAERLVAPFRKWITTGLPYVTLKMAMTLDGRIADAAGRSRWISGPASRRIVQQLRKRADAVMVGSGTAVEDDPSLLSRARGAGESLRIIVDSRGKTPGDARALTDGHPERTIIATTARCSASRQRVYEDAGAEVLRLPAAGGRVSLPSLLRRLGKRGLLHVVCEGGAQLAYGLTAAGLVDEYVFFVAPKMLGSSEALPVVTGKGWSLRNARRLCFEEVKRVGEDVMLRAVPATMRP